jgi:hypothetical protein
MRLKFTTYITYNNKYQKKETPKAGEITKNRVTGVLGYVKRLTALNPTPILDLGSDTTEFRNNRGKFGGGLTGCQALPHQYQVGGDRTAPVHVGP